MQRAQEGDRAALAELLTQQQDRLFHLALRLVSDRDDAADVTQQTMLKVVEQLSEFRGQAQLTTWMRRILVNQAFSLLRKRQTRNKHHAPAATHARADGGDDEGRPGAADPLQNAATREPDPGLRVQQQEVSSRLQAAIDGLEETFRAVLVLRDIDGMNYAEIGEALELAPGTVKSRLFRARLQLRQQLEQLGHDGPDG
jgi:RNA polymerase sigma-70 factor (ECF subfamily)